jgi:quercetin dioxygenase-like cupin family protein
MQLKSIAKLGAVAVLGLSATGASAALDPDALKVIVPKDIQWRPGALGDTALLYGDPTKEGQLYVQLIKWHPNQGTRPHSHPHDRYITVLEGTFWVNTGAKYSRETMVPIKAGNWVFHPANKIHYDGTREDGALIQVVGLGPGTSVDREEK